MASKMIYLVFVVEYCNRQQRDGATITTESLRLEVFSESSSASHRVETLIKLRDAREAEREANDSPIQQLGDESFKSFSIATPRQRQALRDFVRFSLNTTPLDAHQEQQQNQPYRKSRLRRSVDKLVENENRKNDLRLRKLFKVSRVDMNKYHPLHESL